MPALTYVPILAHFGHWYISIPTFMTPVVLLAVAVKVSERRTMRRASEGDTSRLSVVVSQQADSTILTVTGDVSYITLLDLEHEIGTAARRDLPIVLNLRDAKPTEGDFCWSVIELIRATEDAEITVLTGTGETLDELRKVCELEGVKVG